MTGESRSWNGESGTISSGNWPERYDGSFTCHVEHNEFLVDLFLREPEM